MRCVLMLVALVSLTLAVSAVSAEPYVSVWEDAAADQLATSSWFGNVGMIVTPTAAAPPPSAATVQWHRVERDAEDLDIIGVNFGVTDWLELGAARIDDGTDAEEIANVKVLLDIAKWFKEPNWPALAVGALDVSNELDRSLDLVLSKSFEVGGTGAAARRLNVHLGVADSDNDLGALDGVFGGIEFQAFRKGLIQAEYDGHDFNAAIRYSATKRLSVDVGSLDGDLGYGLTYRSSF